MKSGVCIQALKSGTKREEALLRVRFLQKNYIHGIAFFIVEKLAILSYNEVKYELWAEEDVKRRLTVCVTSLMALP